MDRIIELLHQRFLNDGNPLHAWLAYQLWRNDGSPPLPDWIAAYLDGCAESLLSGADADDALKLSTKGGRYTKRDQFNNVARDEVLASYIDLLMTMTADEAQELRWLDPIPRDLFELEGDKLNRVCDYVAELTERSNNRWGLRKPLSSKRLRDIYFENKPRL